MAERRLHLTCAGDNGTFPCIDAKVSVRAAGMKMPPVQAVPLSDEQIDSMWAQRGYGEHEHRDFAHDIERAHGIGEQQ